MPSVDDRLAEIDRRKSEITEQQMHLTAEKKLLEAEKRGIVHERNAADAVRAAERVLQGYGVNAEVKLKAASTEADGVEPS